MIPSNNPKFHYNLSFPNVWNFKNKYYKSKIDSIKSFNIFTYRRLNSNKKGQNAICNINKSVFSKINRKIIFFIANIFIIFLPLKLSGKFRLSFRIFVMRELLKNLVSKN